MIKKREGRKTGPQGFTLIEIMVALLISSVLATAIYSFFITQHHAYTVQDQVIEMEQNARAAMDMIRRELRMAGYNAMGDDLINNLSDFVPSSFIPAYPVTVNLDANPKISEGSGTNPDVITFLSVVPTSYNPAVLKENAEKEDTYIIVDLTKSKGEDQYKEGDMLHIGTCSDYARIDKIEFVNLPSESYKYTKLTIDTTPADSSSNPGLSRSYESGVSVGEISVVSYSVFNEANDPSHTYHDAGHPVLKRKINAGGFQPIAENITDIQLSHLGGGEVQLTLSSQTDRSDYKFQTNSGYRTYTAGAKIKVRNADTVAVGTTCDVPSSPSNLALKGLDDTYPCKIQISWDEVKGSTGCDVTGYKIYYGTTAGSNTYSVDVGDVTSYVLDVDALNACKYYVSAAAINSAGISPKSSEQAIADSLAPASPAGLTVENINGVERKVVLSWDQNTECDLKGYNVFGRSALVPAPAPQINSSIIPREISNYTDSDFTPIDCATYYYSIEAVDYCPNASDSTTEVSASPTAPEPPTGPEFSPSGKTDTISWTLSEDDFEVSKMNYIVEYRVYDPSGVLLATLKPGTDTWTSSSVHNYYDVSAKDACGNESEKLRISSACSDSNKPDKPSIEQPVDSSTVSGKITISGTATAKGGRTISLVELKIDKGSWTTLDGTTTWSYPWNTNTTQVEDGEHTITVKAKDSEGCYIENSITVKVSNSESAASQELSCDVYACIKSAGSSDKHVYLVVKVFDENSDPISGVTIKAAAENIAFNNISETSSPGTYGGSSNPDCKLSTDGNKTISGKIDNKGISAESNLTHSTNETITVTVSKNGYEPGECTRWEE
ncbi:MAG: prepilin-type N-terminal cleavage/methylation domain-containing protein [Desulfotignum sp.]|nr:prepilin-type N-terminal cleavage/methylation domain-containing protein [Desulfotignum sp.]